MTRSAPSRSYPLSMRMPEGDIAIIDRAAGMHGRSRSEFIRDAAVRAAEEAILERTLIRMPPEDFDAFVEALSEKPKVVPEILELMKRKAPWESEGD